MKRIPFLTMETMPQQKWQQILALRIVFFMSCLSLLSLTTFKIYKDVGQRKSEVTGDKTQGKSYFCVENLLDRRSFPSNKKYLLEKKSNCVKQFTTIPDAQCKLLDYSTERVTSCLDILQNIKHSSSKTNVANTAEKKMLHFVFIGDSRIRQQFLNFIKIIPEYDRTVQPNPIPPFHHGQINVNSSLLQLRVSFHWQPVINSHVIQMIRQWTDLPNFVILSMAVHHMITEMDSVSALQFFQRNLTELGLVLSQITNTSQVIWINQYPTVDFYGEIYSHNTAIHARKVHSYNKAARRIIENHKSISLWDSSNRLVEEYVRGCIIFSHRAGKSPAMCGDFFCGNVSIREITYRNCKDYIHTGYVALSLATQFLFNDICNKYFVYTNGRKKKLHITC